MFIWLFRLGWAQDSALLFSSSLQEKIESNLSHDFVGVVHVVQGQKKLYTYTKGKNQQGRGLSTESFVPVSSLTNHIVSLAIIDELKKQELSLDAPIQQFFSRLSDQALTKDEAKCTVRNLLSHRCGLPSFLPGQQEEDQTTFFSSLNRLRLRDAPGSIHRYSYAGENLAMMLLSRLRKGDLYDYLDREYIGDCAIEGGVNPVRQAEQMKSVFYTPFGTGETQFWFHVEPSSYLTLPNHSIASAKGLHCWLSKIKTKANWKELLPKESEDYGLGIALRTRSYGEVLWHSMRIPFQSTGFWGMVPQTDVMVIILSPQSNGPYSIPQLGHMILDEVHGTENNQRFTDRSFAGKMQASLPALFPIMASFGPLMAAFVLFFRPVIPKVPFAFRIQFCFFAALFVRQSTPFASIPMYEWGGMLIMQSGLLFKGLSVRREEPLFYPQRSFGMIVEYVIYGVLMVTWIQRVSNPYPLLLSFFLMVLLVGFTNKK